MEYNTLFILIVKELFNFINKSKINDIILYIIEKIVERSPYGVYHLIFPYFEYKYIHENQDPDDELYDPDDFDGEELPEIIYNAPFSIDDKESLKTYLIEYTEDHCYVFSNIYDNLLCTIGVDRLFPSLEYEDIITIIEYMLELAVIYDNIPKICNHLKNELS